MRPQEEKDIHDKVVTDSAKSYLAITTAENIKVNLGESRNFGIEEQYPDIIVKLPTGEIIIEEVETESTVTEDSVEKWRNLTNLGHEVRILVPLSKLDLAKELASRLTIPVNIQVYAVSGDNIQWFGKN
ncbi:hypothetical protein HYZ70_00125 [Candidatus Curtissbacteria bacterium]|nr:hypothetical protein [Candidatus Curtissbacteria bacterium]